MITLMPLMNFFALVVSGILLGYFSEYLFKKFWRGKKIDRILDSYELPKSIFNISLEDIFGFLIKLSIFLVFLAEAVGYLNLSEIQKFTLSILYFIPNLLRIILVAYIGEFIIEKTKKMSTDVPYGHIFYLSISFIMFLFVGGIILKEMGISEAEILLRIVEIIMWGISAGIAVAVGLIGYLYIKEYMKE